MKTEILLEPIRDVEVQLRTWDIELMTRYAQQIPKKGRYVEIGTKYGGSAYLVRKNSQDNVEVCSIDPNPILYMFKGTEDKVGIKWITGLSLDVAKKWKKKIDLLFIDGDHGEGDPEAPTKDFDAWEKFVNPGGIIMMHDCHPDYPAAVRACDKIMATGKYELLEKPPELAPRQDTDMFVVKKK